MRIFFVAVAVLLCPLIAEAQVSGTITGPKNAEAHELIELQMRIAGDSSIVRLRPQPEQLLERYTADGVKCLIFLPAGKSCYDCELLVFGVVDGKAEAVMASHRVCVDQPEPEPEPEPKPPEPNPPSPPGPKPPTPPSPEPDDGRFGIASVSYRAAKSVDQPETAAKLATVYRDVAGQIREEDAGPLRVLSLIRSACAEIGVHRNGPWKPFNEAVANRLRTLYGNGLLESPGDWADCFDEIAKGLDAAAG